MATIGLTEPLAVDTDVNVHILQSGPGHRVPADIDGAPLTWPGRFVLALAGVLPVALVALAAFGLGLRDLATTLLVPVLVVSMFVAGTSRPACRLVTHAIVAGIAATALYDLFRFSLLGLGVIHRDPIPHIGAALGMEPAWLFGYLWRYIGDGGGLAVAFCVLGFRGLRNGVVFGLAVCAGLLLTLAVSPYGQEMLFPLNVNTVAMATVGHIIYGSVLGAITSEGRGGARRRPLGDRPGAATDAEARRARRGPGATIPRG
jgi:hypothetical protein